MIMCERYNATYGKIELSIQFNLINTKCNSFLLVNICNFLYTPQYIKQSYIYNYYIEHCVIQRDIIE